VTQLYVVHLHGVPGGGDSVTLFVDPSLTGVAPPTATLSDVSNAAGAAVSKTIRLSMKLDNGSAPISVDFDEIAWVSPSLTSHPSGSADSRTLLDRAASLGSMVCWTTTTLSSTSTASSTPTPVRIAPLHTVNEFIQPVFWFTAKNFGLSLFLRLGARHASPPPL